jgi:glycosyltransferase involved in cell wall biosynthesis
MSGTRQADIFVVIPSYNEGDVLAKTLADLSPFAYNIVVVDDGSKVPELEFLPAKVSCRTWYLRHPTNLGQGAALQTGTEFAIKQGAEIVVHFDADGQHVAELIGRLVEPIQRGECDVVMGSRFIDSADRKAVPVRKRFLLKTGVIVSWLFTGVWLTDAHVGFRALSRCAAQKIRLTENGSAHGTQILELIRKERLRYCEVPTRVRYTRYSLRKGQGLLDGINIFFVLLLHKVLG